MTKYGIEVHERGDPGQLLGAALLSAAVGHMRGCVLCVNFKLGKLNRRRAENTVMKPARRKRLVRICNSWGILDMEWASAGTGGPMFSSQTRFRCQSGIV
ncbi:hypothetical protein EVAR_25365_1 [Eumeta japonica]|uniref:Uncharacterized protein n=1 Tax=Eumeta variegata TaxID=151549 RepID=A0A4C1Y084_EUMVA|nr:hypothetical protein EVAR_25365_1 [Eumeta japonica]